MRMVSIYLALLLFFANPAMSQDRISVLDNCTTVSDCFELLEPYIPEKDRGFYEDDIDAAREILKSRFGDGAKYALLDKADGDHGGWRNFASAILSAWGGWTDADVPKLAAVLKRDHGGWIALTLGDIGSPAAIEVLVDDLAYAGFHSQTGWALFQIGPEVLDYLLPALMTRDYDDLPEDAFLSSDGWRSAAQLIGEFRSQATVIADDWIAIAKRRREAPERRIAALRGLAAMNGYVGEKSVSLRPLRRDRDEKIADEAYSTLVALHDPSVAAELAASCRPTGDEWDYFATQSFQCLRTLSEFGANAKGVGSELLKFLDAENSAEQLYAIETLGLIGQSDAIPKIEDFLVSPDWRHVYASVRALGHLKSRSSVSKIEAATRDHWMWELQQFGERTAMLLVRNQPFTETYVSNLGFMMMGRFANYSSLFDFSEECPWAVWEYEGGQLTFDEPQYTREQKIELSGGALVGTDNGEFGGSLVWRSTEGEEVTLVNDNVSFIFQVGDEFITIHGIAHLTISYSFATLVSRDKDGEWAAKEIARFPADVRRAKRLDNGKFAANASGRVVVFDKTGIERAAYCDQRARPNSSQ